jgi:hypothetical protein
VAREVEERGGFDVVEVIEDAGLVGADDGLGGCVANVASVAGEVDLGVAAEDGIDFGGH